MTRAVTYPKRRMPRIVTVQCTCAYSLLTVQQRLGCFFLSFLVLTLHVLSVRGLFVFMLQSKSASLTQRRRLTVLSGSFLREYFTGHPRFIAFLDTLYTSPSRWSKHCILTYMLFRTISIPTGTCISRFMNFLHDCSRCLARSGNYLS